MERVGRLLPRRADLDHGNLAKDVLRSDIYVFDLACRRRNWQTVFTQAFEMKGDGFADFGFNFRYGPAGGYAPW